MKNQSEMELARWGSDDARREYRRGREAQIAPQLTARREAAARVGGSVEIPRDAGFLSCEASRFPDVDAVVESGREVLATADLEKRKAKANKPYMMRLLAHDPMTLTLDSPFLRLALHPEVVAAASRYLGLVPVLQFVNVYYSSYSGPDLNKSQLYHCDSDDTEQVKVFVLCEEVRQETGPLTLLPPPESAIVRKGVGYRYDQVLTDEQVGETLGGLDAERQMVGPAGTVAFIDSSRCLHYGSRFVDPTLTRLIVMLQYVTPLSFILPAEYWEGARYRSLCNTPGLDDLSQMVLGSA